VTPALLDDLVRGAASEVLAVRGLDPAALPADPGVGCPRDGAHGEYATAVALRAASRVGVPPRELAGWLAGALATRLEVATAQVDGPGFLNLWMTPAGRAAVVADALQSEVDGAALRAAVPDAADDAARYALIRSIDDVALLGRRVFENPLFRVQYAHARLVALARGAAELGVAAELSISAEPDLGVLTHPCEIELVRGVAGFPAMVRTGVPHRVARHLEGLAEAVLDLNDSCPVLPRGDEAVTELHRARLAAAVAARRVLATGLGLLGLSAPERI
jgi:arginyl-tRNA synthetase